MDFKNAKAALDYVKSKHIEAIKNGVKTRLHPDWVSWSTLFNRLIMSKLTESNEKSPEYVSWWDVHLYWQQASSSLKYHTTESIPENFDTETIRELLIKTGVQDSTIAKTLKININVVYRYKYDQYMERLDVLTDGIKKH